MMQAIRHILPKIVESPFVPEGQVYIMNDLGLDVRRPADWDSMSAKDQLAWAVDNGMAVVIKKSDA